MKEASLQGMAGTVALRMQVTLQAREAPVTAASCHWGLASPRPHLWSLCLALPSFLFTHVLCTEMPFHCLLPATSVCLRHRISREAGVLLPSMTHGKGR